MTEQEEWKDIPGFEGRYQASSLGRIRSLDRLVERHYADGRTDYRPLKGRVLRQTLNKGNGYLMTSLGGTTKQETHRFVAWAFLGEQVGALHVNHKDGNKQNNCILNLEYISCGDNHVHALATRGKFGYLENSKLSAEQVLSIYGRLLIGEVVQDLATEYGVDRHTISGIKTRKRWNYLTKGLPDIPKTRWTRKEKR